MAADITAASIEKHPVRASPNWKPTCVWLHTPWPRARASWPPWWAMTGIALDKLSSQKAIEASLFSVSDDTQTGLVTLNVGRAGQHEAVGELGGL